MERLSPEDDELLCRAILALRDPADCRRFFADLCTIQELHDLAQRVRVARMLMDQANYKEISRATGMSTATISRVNRSLSYGTGGYRDVLDRVASDSQKGAD